MTVRLKRALWFLVGMWLFVASEAVGQPAAIDLGTLGGLSSWVESNKALNAGGSVVGRSAVPDGSVQAFWWTPTGGMVDLGTLAGGYSVAVEMSR